MNATGASDWLAVCGLPGAWADQTGWTVLDTHFGNAQAFVQCWKAWREDPHRPRMLHYVGIASQPPHADTLSAQAGNGTDAALWQSLADQFQGRGTGFHRILLNDAQVSLTLCVGDVIAMLKEQRMQADTVRAHYSGDPWLVQWLARHSRRGARAYLQENAPHTDVGPTARDALLSAGFKLDVSPTATETATSKAPALFAQFLPHWNIAHRRTAVCPERPVPARCAVVGAGISGTSAAHALALRGWQVTVFDQEREPASAASGLPVGLAVPYVSADDSPRARLSRSGTRLAMQHAQQFLEDGRNWAPSGAQERRPDGTTLWHAYAAWIQPRALVRAWLSHPNITFTALAQVSALQRLGNLWQLNRPHGEPWGSFEHVVVANAMGCKTLLRPLVATESAAGWAPGVAEQLAALAPLHGTLSHGSYVQHIAGLPRTPVNGNGCFFPHIPGPHGDQWAAGSTFETDALEAADLGQQHSINLHRLRQLLPELGDNLVHALDSGPVSLWSSTRCTTRDRLPLVGSADTAAHSGVWFSVGMGARGLSFAPLCAELLVAEMCAEPLPLERSLARSLHAGRPRRTKPFEAGLLPGEG